MHDLIIGKDGFMIATAQHLIGLDYGGDFFFYRQHVTRPEELYLFGRKGQGPDELLRPHMLQYISEDLIGSYDLFAGTFHEISLNPHAEHIKSKTVSFHSGRTSYFVLKTACDQYIGIGPYPDAMFTLFDSSGHKIKSFFEFPFSDAEEKKIENHIRAMAYQGKIVANSSGTKFAYAAGYADIIHFYHVTNNDIQLIKKIEHRFCEYVPQVEGRSVSAAIRSTNRKGYFDLYATDKYIYLLYSGKTFQEYGVKSIESNQLKIYDWTGNLWKDAVLDIPCRYLCVSPDDKNMWAIAEIPEPTIVRFNLTSLD
jgi:hypothetical protein